MKTKLFIPTLFLLLVLVGCAGRLLTPVYAPQPPGATNAPVIVAWIPNTNAVNAAGTVGQLSPIIPPPGNWIVGGLAALFTAGLGTYARMKTNQTTKAQDILNAVITGVEAAGNTQVPQTTANVKSSIATHVAATGYGNDFDKQVQEMSKQVNQV